MGLTPEISMPELYQSERLPSRTYKLDKVNRRIIGKVDGLEAIKQFIYKAIRTPRFRYAIYSAFYGCEAESIVGEKVSGSLKESELIRMITEALIYDDRINRVYDFTIDSKGDEVRVFFKVNTVEGTLDIEEVFQ